MTIELAPLDSWDWVRSDSFHSDARTLIESSRNDVLSVSHVRTAHYATYKVVTQDQSEWLVRVGLREESNEAPVDNTGFLGTSRTRPTGQLREFEVAHGYDRAGASVCAPLFQLYTGEYDIMWLPFLIGVQEGITAEQWVSTLADLRKYRPAEEAPVFTNRAKTMERLEGFHDKELALTLAEEYDQNMQVLFEAASEWSVVHGDVHGGNALVVNGQVVMFDFDTACWAPSVWDFTHLLNRAGTGVNSAFTADQLMTLSGYGSNELNAALKLRRTASRIAKIANRGQSPIVARAGGNPEPVPEAVRSA